MFLFSKAWSCIRVWKSLLQLDCHSYDNDILTRLKEASLDYIVYSLLKNSALFSIICLMLTLYSFYSCPYNYIRRSTCCSKNSIISSHWQTRTKSRARSLFACRYARLPIPSNQSECASATTKSATTKASIDKNDTQAEIDSEANVQSGFERKKPEWKEK